MWSIVYKTIIKIFYRPTPTNVKSMNTRNIEVVSYCFSAAAYIIYNAHEYLEGYVTTGSVMRSQNT